MFLTYSAVFNTYVLNVSEYINRLCDKNLPSYSLMDCRKVNSDEQRLLRYLMRNYEKDVRPVHNHSKTVTVFVGLTLTQIFDLEEKNQFLISNVWLDNEWYDEFLTWDPDKFNGLKSIRIPSRRIWLPDLVLYNNADDYFSYKKDTYAMIYNNGKVFWPVPTKLQSTCKFDVTFFPFDIQRCFLKIGSWTYDGFQVDIMNRSENIDLSNYVPNGEWDLVRTYCVRRVVYYPCCREPFPDVTFTLIIRRKVLYFTVNVILPCLMLSALTVLVFVIPSDSGDKVTLGITVFLAFSVIMLAVAENLPETSEYVPLISIYLTVIMFTASLSVICTVFVLNLHHRRSAKRRVPNWLRRIFIGPDDISFGAKANELKVLFNMANHMDKNRNQRIHDNKLNNSIHKMESFLSTESDVDLACSNEPSTVNERHKKKLLNVNSNFQRKKDWTNMYTSGLTLVDDQHQKSNDNSHYLVIESSNQSEKENVSKLKLINSSLTVDRKSKNVFDCQCGNQNNKANNFKRLKLKKNKLGGPSDFNESIRCRSVKPNCDKHNENCCLYDIVLNSMKNIHDIKSMEESERVILEEWKQVASKVDKLLFWIFLIVTFVFSLVCLVIVPSYQNSKLYEM
ncbi:Cation transporter family [Brachionus plicatilis]|uniref:Cation transporter family n=1 Tax=Brachionus plicatilis TaxID=10195 RepID=A0A3M7SMY9_BRAPC|nr:Cation transporter family [Brachionus plicatilis]